MLQTFAGDRIWIYTWKFVPMASILTKRDELSYCLVGHADPLTARYVFKLSSNMCDSPCVKKQLLQ